MASSNFVNAYITQQPNSRERDRVLQRRIALMIRNGFITDSDNIMRTVLVRERDGRMRSTIDLRGQEEIDEDIVVVNHITISNDTLTVEEDAEDAPPEVEEGVKAIVDELKDVNLGDDNDLRPTYISALLTIEEEEAYIKLLREFRDVFAWSYKEIPGLDPKVAVHHLSIKKGTQPVKQGQCRFRPELVPLIENEVNKLIEVRFIQEVKYPTWISSIVPVRKKNGHIRVCVDFRDHSTSRVLKMIFHYLSPNL